ncbi:MAG: hypothetical protein AABX65_03600, partial [Nanoarchaeota archaeon]
MEMKEVLSILLGAVVLAFVMQLLYKDLAGRTFFLFALFFLIIIFVNTFAKYFAAAYYLVKAEVAVWSVQQYWFYEGAHFKKPLPFGVLLPIFFAVFSFGAVPWLAVLQTNLTPTKARATRRFPMDYSFSEMTDFHSGMVCAAGIFATLVLAVVSLYLGYYQLAKFAGAYAIFNLIPLGQLDGTKILFSYGHFPGKTSLATATLLWIFLAVASL